MGSKKLLLSPLLLRLLSRLVSVSGSRRKLLSALLGLVSRRLSWELLGLVSRRRRLVLALLDLVSRRLAWALLDLVSRRRRLVLALLDLVSLQSEPRRLHSRLEPRDLRKVAPPPHPALRLDHQDTRQDTHPAM